MIYLSSAALFVSEIRDNSKALAIYSSDLILFRTETNYNALASIGCYKYSSRIVFLGCRDKLLFIYKSFSVSFPRHLAPLTIALP